MTAQAVRDARGRLTPTEYRALQSAMAAYRHGLIGLRKLERCIELAAQAEMERAAAERRRP